MGLSGLFSLKNVLLFSISFILTVKQVVPNDNGENVDRSGVAEGQTDSIPDVTGVRYRLCERDNFSLDMIITSSLMRFIFGDREGSADNDVDGEAGDEADNDEAEADEP